MPDITELNALCQEIGQEAAEANVEALVADLEEEEYNAMMLAMGPRAWAHSHWARHLDWPHSLANPWQWQCRHRPWETPRSPWSGRRYFPRHSAWPSLWRTHPTPVASQCRPPETWSTHLLIACGCHRKTHSTSPASPKAGIIKVNAKRQTSWFYQSLSVNRMHQAIHKGKRVY